MLKTLLFRFYTGILAREAQLFRDRYSGPLIAITGSVGKTGTKDVIGKVMRKAYGDDCIITPKSLNAELGIPLTLLGFKSEPKTFLGWVMVPFRGLIVALFGKTPKCIVLEVGTEHKGDIAKFSRLIRPTHAIITRVSEVHSAEMGSLKALQEEKSSLLQFVDLNGAIYLNGDDEFLSKLRVEPTQQKYLVRLHKRADYFASGIKVGIDGTQAVLHHGNRTQRLHIKRYGEHHIYSVLFAAAVADSLDIPPSVQLQAFKEIRPVPGRGALLHGKKGSIIIDESYNADPASMEAALELLGSLPAKRRIAVLGDMRALSEPDAAHREIGRLSRHYTDYMIGVGPLSKLYKPDEWFMTAREAIASTLRELGPGVIVLIKGSQNTIRLERLIKEIMASPEKADKLLVRQDPEWERRP